MAALIQFASGAPGIKYTLDKQEFHIGRKAALNDICLSDGFVSKQHARIVVVENLTADGYEYFIEDLQSTNKTYVNDEPIGRVKLDHNDVIRIGRNSFRFDGLSDSPSIEQFEANSSVDDLSSQSKTWNFSRRLRMLGVD